MSQRHGYLLNGVLLLLWGGYAIPWLPGGVLGSIEHGPAVAREKGSEESEARSETISYTISACYS